MDQKTIKLITLGIIGLFLLIGLFMSWEDVEPGEEGFLYRPYGGGVETKTSFNEGTYFIAPWNEIITYNVRQQSKTYASEVMDINGTDITVKVAVNYSAQKGKTAKLHLKHGPISIDEDGKVIGGYVNIIDDKVKGAIKDVIGRYTYEQVYSSKREALEGEIEEILKHDFEGNFINLHYVEIADVNLPKNIATEITNKETQKQKNLTAQQKKQEQIYLAAAKIEAAKGDSAKLIINATSEAEAIKIKQQQLRQSPQYIEYMKAQRWDGKMPQVVTSGGSGLIIDMKKN
jgi:prohibitin 1